MFWETQRWMRSQFMWHKSPLIVKPFPSLQLTRSAAGQNGKSAGVQAAFPSAGTLAMSNTSSAFHLPLWRHLIGSLHASLVTHTTSVFGFSFPWATANVIRLQDTWKQRKLPLGKPCYSLTISFEFCLFLDLDFILDFSVCLLVSKSRFNFLLCIIVYFVTNMPTHTCNPTTHETKAGGPGVPAQNRVHSTIIHR